MLLLTQVAMEKNEKATVARAASWGIPLTSWVRPHWLASRQKHTNHRKVHAPRKHTDAQTQDTDVNDCFSTLRGITTEKSLIWDPHPTQYEKTISPGQPYKRIETSTQRKELSCHHLPNYCKLFFQTTTSLCPWRMADCELQLQTADECFISN